MQAIITIPGKPKGKDRPRFWQGHAVTSASTRAYERLVKSIYKKETSTTFHGAVAVSIKAYYQIPKSTPKAARMMMLEGDRLPCVKPDIDNIPKTILDALNGVAYDDDKQVVHLTVSKRYAEEARVDVEVKEV